MRMSIGATVMYPRKISALVLVLVLAQTAWGQGAHSTSPEYNTGGFLRHGRHHELQVVSTPRALITAEPQEKYAGLRDQAERLLNSGSVTSLMLLERDRIIYEGYQRPSGPRRLQFSYSMSKSLTGMTIGAMLCSGRIPSLDTPAQHLVPGLANTAWGRATVRQLLTMTAGVPGTMGSGRRYEGEVSDLIKGRTSAQALLRRYDDPQGQNFDRGFVYSNADTLVLGQIAEAQGGMVEMFDRYVWQPARPERAGYWLLDTQGHAVTATGFGAITRDWARLALYSLDLLNGQEDACMRGYMQAATSRQVSVVDDHFRGYGFQTWTDPKHGQGYWWQGHSGQRVAVDAQRGLILVITSYSALHDRRTHELWQSFQQAYQRR